MDCFIPLLQWCVFLGIISRHSYGESSMGHFPSITHLDPASFGKLAESQSAERRNETRSYEILQLTAITIRCRGGTSTQP